MGTMPPAWTWDTAVERAYDAIIEAADYNLSVERGEWDSWRNGEHLLRWADPENSHFALSAMHREELIECLDVFLSEEHERIRARRSAERDEP